MSSRCVLPHVAVWWRLLPAAGMSKAVIPPVSSWCTPVVLSFWPALMVSVRALTCCWRLAKWAGPTNGNGCLAVVMFTVNIVTGSGCSLSTRHCGGGGGGGSSSSSSSSSSNNNNNSCSSAVVVIAAVVVLLVVVVVVVAVVVAVLVVLVVVVMVVVVVVV